MVRILSIAVTFLSITAAVHSANAQSAREQAVAIDRVAIPPPDTMQVERIGPLMKAPWSLAFLPDGSMLVTEKHGGIRHIQRSGAYSEALEGGPTNVLQESDSGLLDIVLDPDFQQNGQVYVAFAEGSEESNRTAVWKARFDGRALTGGRVIFRVNHAKSGTGHPGGRMLFLPDKSLLLSVGDGFSLKQQAQDPASHLGKVLRLNRDGSAPSDNPFAGRAGHAPEIWSMGHRNIQGLARDPATGTIWSHEHGPRGGDEINVLEAGRNYGWPLATSGIDYDGKLISELAHGSDWASPRLMWAPSIAPSGLAIYHGALFPELEGRLLVGGLVSRGISQVRIHPKTGLLAEEARLLSGMKQRIRDVRVAPDGNIYWLSDSSPDGGLYRVMPPAEQLAAPRHGHQRSIRELSFLLGSWKGESQFLAISPPPPRLTTETICQPALKGTYIECSAASTGNSGRTAAIKIFYNYDDRARVIHVRLLESAWGTETSYKIDRDPESGAYIGIFPTTDSEGRAAEERVVMTISPDGRALDTRTFMRASGSQMWKPTHRSSLTKI
ncbi:MAG TPA: PQQ-dependent sugar dehydrogenase [Sphingomicrobium sp.]|nr:PQQ-dependent sugar dehydrogenase [Sphingomicrobium sp.]